MTKLLPCPFCGGEANVVKVWQLTMPSFSAGCKNSENCRVSPYVYSSTRKDAIERWNIRKP